MTDDPRLRFRIWVDAHLVDEVWLNSSDPADRARVPEVRDAHLAIAEAADKDGLLWLVEVYDPALPDDVAYQRIGTDTRGMTAPVVVWEGTTPAGERIRVIGSDGATG